MNYLDISNSQELWKVIIDNLIATEDPKNLWRYQDHHNQNRLWRMARVDGNKIILWLELHNIIHDDQTRWCILSDQIDDLSKEGRFTDGEIVTLQKLSEKLELALLKSIEDREKQLMVEKGLDPDRKYRLVAQIFIPSAPNQ